MTKIVFFPDTGGSISLKLGMKHQGIKSIIFFSNGDTVLTLTYFTARSNFETLGFTWENVTINDGFFGNYCKLYVLYRVSKK